MRSPQATSGSVLEASPVMVLTKLPLLAAWEGPLHLSLNPHHFGNGFLGMLNTYFALIFTSCVDWRNPLR